jgi:hypothetical protein
LFYAKNSRTLLILYNKMYRLRNNYQLIIIIILFIFIIVPRLYFSDLDHGDEFSDANVLNAGENFVKLGFIECRFLPAFEPQIDAPSNLYTHYPPLPDIINGLLRLIFKTDSLRFFRGVSLFFAFFNLLFWYLFIKKLTDSEMIGFLSVLFYLTNPLFIFGADSLHQLSYSDFLRSLCFFVFATAIKLPGKKKVYICLLWVLLVIASLITYEYIIYFSLFFILFRFFFKTTLENLSKRAIILLLLSPIVGFLLHFLQNVWYFGSFHLAFQDLLNVAIERTLYGTNSPPLNLTIWLHKIVLGNFSLVLLFSYPVLIASVFFSYLLYRQLSLERKIEIKSLFRLTILFSICGISWYVFFPAHSWHHVYLSFLARHLVPVASLGFTIFSYIIYSFIKDRINTDINIFRICRVALCSKVLLVFIISLIAIIGITKSELPVTIDKIHNAQDFLKFKTCLLMLRNFSAPRETIGINYFRYPMVQYYTKRQCFRIFNARQLENMQDFAQYFIFVPYDDQNSRNLLNNLMQRYHFLFQCDSSRFPVFFLQLNQ